MINKINIKNKIKQKNCLVSTRQQIEILLKFMKQIEKKTKTKQKIRINMILF